MATTDITTNSLQEWRVAMFEELGFSKEEAEKLCEVVTTVVINNSGGLPRRYEQVLTHHDVRKLMEKGATKEQILRIYL